jgi:septum site-determining protein MinC
MSADPSPLEFKSATLYTLRAVLRTSELAPLTESLAKRMQEAGSFFSGEAVVLDASGVQGPIDWTALVQAFDTHQLPVIGVVAQGDNLKAAQAAGIASVELSSNTPRTTTAPQAASEASEPVESATPVPMVDTQEAEPVAPVSVSHEAPTPDHLPTLVIQGPLRSGQRVYARGSDLIIMGVVSQGAEVIADGNIHVYGPLRGKAMAGARGDEQARVFTTSLDAELVAIAGVYRVIDTKLPPTVHRKPVMVFLKDQALRIEALGD